MIDNKPTDEQVEKFWEWCGFEACGSKEKGIIFGWKRPGIKSGKFIPENLLPINLNTLFQYAVPKLQDAGYQVDMVAFEHKGFQFHVWNVISDKKPTGTAENINPALALFWAIWNVIKNAEK